MRKTEKTTGIRVSVFAILAAIMCAVFLLPQRETYAASNTMLITAIDLGDANTGEATMITAGDGGSLLIDTGDNHNRTIFTWLAD